MALSAGGAGNAMHAVLEDVLCLVFQAVLSLHSLRPLCGVSRRWAYAAAHAESWVGKEIILWNTDIGREDLLRWWPAWRFARRVYLTCRQLGAHPGPPPPRHTVWYEWGTWTAPMGDEWHPVCLFGDSGFACLSRLPVPDNVGLYQLHAFWTAVMIGWSTARTPSELELMFERWYENDSLPSDQIVWTKMCAADSQGAEDARQRRRGGALFYHSLFDQEDWEMAQLHLYREDQALRITTTVTGTRLSAPAFVRPVRPEAELRFFMIIPDLLDHRYLPSAQILIPTEGGCDGDIA